MKKILYIQYTNPAAYPCLGRSSEILAEDGWKITFCGTEAFGSKKLRFLDHSNVRVKYINFCKAGLRQKLHYLKYFFWVFREVLLWRPKWLYVSDILACPIAALFSYIPFIKVLYHEHDSPPAEAGSVFFRILLFTRKVLSRRAVICVLPNEKRLKRFKKTVRRRKKTYCVYNCPRRKEVRASKAGKKIDKLSLYYHGSINSSKIPVSIIEAIAKLPDDVMLNIAGYETVGSRGYADYLKKTAEKLNAENRFKFFGPVNNRKTLYDNCYLSDLGLISLSKDSGDINEEMMVGASNKTFDYLACGLALLVPELADWHKAYIEPGYGLACNLHDQESTTSVLRYLLEHREEIRRMGEMGRQRIIDEWNYEKQFEPVKYELKKF